MTDNQNIPLEDIPLEKADLNGDGFLSEEEIIAYRKNVVHYFDNQVGADILNLSTEDKERFFQMAHDYSDIIVKFLHKGVNIFEHIAYGDAFYSAKQDPHEGINWDHECEIVKQYEEWKKSKQ